MWTSQYILVFFLENLVLIVYVPKFWFVVLLFQVFETLETNKKNSGLRICNKIGEAIKLKTMSSYYNYQIIHTNMAQYSGSCRFEPIVV